MKLRAKEPIRYKGLRYEPEEIFDADSTDFKILEPFVETLNKQTNKKNVENINRVNDENSTASTENID
ncbi:MAG: hypothetical protein ACK40U_06650 [Fervidobacterium pennivorans]